jgi:hypothetical protein
MRYFLLLFLFMPFVSAHGFDTAQTIVRGNHTIEFGTSVEELVAGERAVLSFALDEAGVPVETHDVFIRISQGDTILFASNSFATSPDSILTVSYVFPEPGLYDIDFAAGKTTAMFPVTVAPQQTTPVPLFVGGVAAIVAVFAVLLSRRVRLKR